MAAARSAERCRTSVWALQPIQAAHPGRFAVIKPVDPNDPAVADTIGDWTATPGAVGVRAMMREGASTDPAAPERRFAFALTTTRPHPAVERPASPPRTSVHAGR